MPVIVEVFYPNQPTSLENMLAQKGLGGRSHFFEGRVQRRQVIKVPSIGNSPPCTVLIHSTGARIAVNGNLEKPAELSPRQDNNQFLIQQPDGRVVARVRCFVSHELSPLA